MKITTTNFVLSILVSSFALFNLSCSKESYGDNTDIEEDMFAMRMPGDVFETTVNNTDQILFTTQINGGEFIPTKIKTAIDKDKIHILATDETHEKSIFLIFVMEADDTLVLGRTYVNMDNNTAGYLIDSRNESFLTSEMYQECGGIRITEVDTDGNSISGEFYFTARNKDGEVMDFKEGVFTNLPLPINGVSHVAL